MTLFTCAPSPADGRKLREVAGRAPSRRRANQREGGNGRPVSDERAIRKTRSNGGPADSL